MPLWAGLTLRRVEHAKNQSLVGKTLADIAAERGTTPLAVMIDLSIEEDLKAHFLAADMGHNLDHIVGPLLKDEQVMIGASDGGAHILSFSTYGDTGYLFSRSFVTTHKSLFRRPFIKSPRHRLTYGALRIEAPSKKE